MQSRQTCLFAVFIFLLLQLGQTTVQLPVLLTNYLFDLYAFNSPSIAQLAQDWNINGVVSSTQSKISYCGGDPILGGYGIITSQDTLQRTYSSLPAHQMISFSIRLFIIDQWLAGETLQVSVDGTTVISFEPHAVIAAEGSSKCGNSNLDAHVYLMGSLVHSGASLSIVISSNTHNSLASYGILDVKMRMITNNNQAQQPCVASTSSASIGIPGVCPCIFGKYQDSSSTCQSCDGSCEQCFGPAQSDCIACAVRSVFDTDVGSCISCTANCIFCTGSAANECHLCWSSLLFWDNTCSSATCAAPYIQETLDFGFCKTPCQDSDTYMNLDNSCSSSCSAPLIERTDGDAKFCDSPCGSTSTSYAYWNGSCKSTCPYYPVIQNGYKVCDACQPNYFMYENNTCLSECPAPYVQKSVGGSSFCDSPCPSGEYYNTDKAKCQSTCQYPYKIEQEILCVLDLSTEELNQVQTITTAVGTVDYALNFVRATISVINFSNPAAVLIQAFVDMLKYLKYINVTYPPKVLAMFSENFELPFSLTPALPDRFTNNVPNYPLPGKFDDYDEFESDFIINFWNSLFVLLVLGTIIILSLLVGFFTKSCKPVQKISRKVLDILKWNFSLSTFTANFGDIVLFSSFEFRTADPRNSVFQALSFSLCCFLSLLAIFVFGKMIMIIRAHWNFLKLKNRSRRTIKNVRIPSSLKEFEVIFEECEEKSFHQQAFMWYFTGRMCLVRLVLAYLFDYPFVQIIILTLASLIMLLYLLISRPVKGKIDLIQYALQEFVLLIAKATVLMFSIFDHFNLNVDNSVREALGEVIIACNIAFSAIGGMYMLIQTFLTIRNIWRNLRRRREKTFIITTNRSSFVINSSVTQNSDSKTLRGSERSMNQLSPALESSMTSIDIMTASNSSTSQNLSKFTRKIKRSSNKIANHALFEDLEQQVPKRRLRKKRNGLA